MPIISRMTTNNYNQTKMKWIGIRQMILLMTEVGFHRAEN
jgi:hypothetical protein